MSAQSHHIRTEDLSAHIDGMVSEPERSAINHHLATCAECRAELDELRATVHLLTQLPQFTPRRSFQLGMDHVTHRHRQSPIIRLLPMVRSLSVAAVILFMVTFGALLIGRTSDDVDRSAVPRSGVQSETASGDGASQGTGEAGTSDERLIDRGAAASSGNDPLEDLTNLEEGRRSAADQASSDVAGVDDATTLDSGFPGRLTSEYGPAFVIALGILALILVCFWIVLMRMKRSGHRSNM